MRLRDSPTDEIERLDHLIKGMKVAILTTICADGTLHSRPMLTQDSAFDGTLWFITSFDSPKVGELEERYQVNVSFSDPDEHRFVTVSGRAWIVIDREKIGQLWSPDHERWFPHGQEDPNLALVRVDAIKAEFWDANSHAMLQLVDPS